MSNMRPDAEGIAAVISSRRTINEFHEELPPSELLLQGLELACWAPNHKLTEPWRYYLLGRETSAQIVELNAAIIEQTQGAEAAQQKREKWSSIPGWLIVTFQRAEDDLRNRENYAAVCCAIQNLSLFLWSSGVGMKWTTGPVTRSPEIYQILNLDPTCEEIVGVMWYGYPKSIPPTKRHPSTDFIKQLP